MQAAGSCTHASAAELQFRVGYERGSPNRPSDKLRSGQTYPLPLCGHGRNEGPMTAMPWGLCSEDEVPAKKKQPSPDSALSQSLAKVSVLWFSKFLLRFPRQRKWSITAPCSQVVHRQAAADDCKVREVGVIFTTDMLLLLCYLDVRFEFMMKIDSPSTRSAKFSVARMPQHSEFGAQVNIYLKRRLIYRIRTLCFNIELKEVSWMVREGRQLSLKIWVCKDV